MSAPRVDFEDKSSLLAPRADFEKDFTTPPALRTSQRRKSSLNTDRHRPFTGGPRLSNTDRHRLLTEGSRLSDTNRHGSCKEGPRPLDATTEETTQRSEKAGYFRTGADIQGGSGEGHSRGCELGEYTENTKGGA